MDKKKILLKDIPKVEPFKTPEGYFENFADGIMSQLPVVYQNEPVKLNLWHRARPWIYMAAMFAGIALILRIFVASPSLGTKNYASEGLRLTSSSDIDDYYSYYEEGLARLAYDEAFYSDDDMENDAVFPE